LGLGLGSDLTGDAFARDSFELAIGCGEVTLGLCGWTRGASGAGASSGRGADDVTGVFRFPNMGLYARAFMSLSRSRRGPSSDERLAVCSDRSVRRSAKARKASAGFDLSETSSII
jgi:hypothetical protein